jgi:hypothetical protein
LQAALLLEAGLAAAAEHPEPSTREHDAGRQGGDGGETAEDHRPALVAGDEPEEHGRRPEDQHQPDDGAPRPRPLFHRVAHCAASRPACETSIRLTAGRDDAQRHVHGARDE